MKYTAVAFDLDGTLYPNFRFYWRLIPFLAKEQRLVRAFGEARRRLRNSDRNPGSGEREKTGGGFYESQARIIGELLNEDAKIIRERVERLIYRGWEPLYKKVRLFPHVRETLDSFRKKGVRIGLLSDFPPGAKLENLGLSGYWDAVLCSEHSGHLKPDSAPFMELARLMEMPLQKILYVGNSVSYDVAGAQKAGMKAALIRPWWKKCPSAVAADFIFYDYRQLCEYVLS